MSAVPVPVAENEPHPCALLGGCRNPELGVSGRQHRCPKCHAPIHNLCFQGLTGTEDQPAAGFLCGGSACQKQMSAVSKAAVITAATERGVSVATLDQLPCSAGLHCVARGDQLVASASCCGVLRHFKCLAMPCHPTCAAKDVDQQEDEEVAEDEEEEEEEEEEKEKEEEDVSRETVSGPSEGSGKGGAPVPGLGAAGSANDMVLGTTDLSSADGGGATGATGGNRKHMGRGQSNSSRASSGSAGAPSRNVSAPQTPTKSATTTPRSATTRRAQEMERLTTLNQSSMQFNAIELAISDCMKSSRFHKDLKLALSSDVSDAAAKKQINVCLQNHASKYLESAKLVGVTHGSEFVVKHLKQPVTTAMEALNGVIAQLKGTAAKKVGGSDSPSTLSRQASKMPTTAQIKAAAKSGAEEAVKAAAGKSVGKSGTDEATNQAIARLGKNMAELEAKVDKLLQQQPKVDQLLQQQAKVDSALKHIVEKHEADTQAVKTEMMGGFRLACDFIVKEVVKEMRSEGKRKAETDRPTSSETPESASRTPRRRSPRNRRGTNNGKNTQFNEHDEMRSRSRGLQSDASEQHHMMTRVALAASEAGRLHAERMQMHNAMFPQASTGATANPFAPIQGGMYGSSAMASGFPPAQANQYPRFQF